MRAPSVGEIVLIPFPLSDLSQSKVRPAVLLAKVDLSQIACDFLTSRFRVGDA